jgi:hypothetical protein
MPAVSYWDESSFRSTTISIFSQRHREFDDLMLISGWGFFGSREESEFPLLTSLH